MTTTNTRANIEFGLNIAIAVAIVLIADPWVYQSMMFKWDRCPLSKYPALLQY